MLWVLLGSAILGAAILLLARFCYRIAFFNANLQEQDAYIIPPGKQHEKDADTILHMIHNADTLPYEQVYIKAHDGTQLAARYHHVKTGAPLQILVHGFHSSAVRDMCGLSQLAREMGFNTLMVDQRAHGKSGGHTITFGVKERCDCLDWVRYAVERFGADTKIVLAGLSMGAATVLMASELLLPDNVVGIVADCPYASPGGIIRTVARSIHIPGWLVYPFVVLGGLVYGHFWLPGNSAVHAVRDARVPILLLHGEADRLVPCKMSVAIFNACAAPKRLETFPNAGHGLSYVVDPARYKRIIGEFLRSCGFKPS